jgi:DNA-binding transcriptional MerR regulator
MGQVATILDVNKSTLDRWERANKIPKPKRVKGTGERSYSDELVATIRSWRDQKHQLVDSWEDSDAARPAKAEQ